MYGVYTTRSFNARIRLLVRGSRLLLCSASSKREAYHSWRICLEYRLDSVIGSTFCIYYIKVMSVIRKCAIVFIVILSINLTLFPIGCQRNLLFDTTFSLLLRANNSSAWLQPCFSSYYVVDSIMMRILTLIPAAEIAFKAWSTSTMFKLLRLLR